MFNIKDGKKLFKYTKDDYALARAAGKACKQFSEDDEDEQVDSIIVSCFNCRYRRWTRLSFECLKR